MKDVFFFFSMKKFNDLVMSEFWYERPLPHFPGNAKRFVELRPRLLYLLSGHCQKFPGAFILKCHISWRLPARKSWEKKTLERKQNVDRDVFIKFKWNTRGKLNGHFSCYTICSLIIKTSTGLWVIHAKVYILEMFCIRSESVTDEFQWIISSYWTEKQWALD